MAALPTGAIPTPPQNLGADDAARQEYFDALSKTLQALEVRAGAGPNLWNVAGAFLNPGRTGSFGESLGNVASTVGKDVERQQELALPIAQMRANIAGQKYQVENEAKALNMFANAVGVSPAEAAAAVNSGEMPPDMLSRIPSNLYVAINKLDPKLGEGIKNAFNMDVERRKLVNQDIEGGMKYADLVAKYGPKVDSYVSRNFRSSGAAPAAEPSAAAAPAVAAPAAAAPAAAAPAATAPAAAEPAARKLMSPKDLARQIETDFGITLGPAATERTAQQQQDLLDRFNRGEKGIYRPAPIVEGKQVYHENAIDVPTSVPESYLRARGYHRPDKNDPVHAVPIEESRPAAAARPSPTAAAKIDVNSVPLDADISSMPLAVQAQVREARAKSQDKLYEKHREEILSYTPQATEATANRLRELHSIADKRPRIFGLMQQQGLLSAIKNSAQEGFNLGRGYNISVPVQTFEEKNKLSPVEQRILRRASQLLAEQFFEDAKAEKSVLGPSISNVDSQFMQRPMVTERDAASTVKYWVKNHLLLNSQRNELFRSLNQHDTTYGTRVPFGSYFGSNEYLGVTKKYSDLNRQLRERYPDFGSK